MNSSEDQLSHSADYCKEKNYSQPELDENSINKANVTFKPNYFKTPYVGNNKEIAVGLLKRIEILQRKLDILEAKQATSPRKKKKIRRKAKEIPRVFICQFSNCGKQYGSEASLKNHHKIKHGIRIIRKAKLSFNKNSLIVEK